VQASRSILDSVPGHNDDASRAIWINPQYRLIFRQSGVNVGIGKYLTEKVYLELGRTPNPSQPWKGNLEIELTPSINLESSTGGRKGIEGAKLKWKRDD
jgi:hypothetical protein